MAINGQYDRKIKGPPVTMRDLMFLMISEKKKFKNFIFEEKWNETGFLGKSAKSYIAYII